MSITLSPAGAPANPQALHAFLAANLDLRVSRTPLMDGSSAPFEYLAHAFFEGRSFDPHDARDPLDQPEVDAIVWASRGSGKTFLAAVATLLDLLFKPGVEVHLLAGSVEQGRRLYHHLRALLDRPNLADFVDGKVTSRGVKLVNGSRVELLAQSETSVRGCRVQKLRCDEIELFDPEVWNAAQLVTRSMPLPGPWGSEVRGAIDALSTMHRPYGLMWELLGQSIGPEIADPDSAPPREAAPAAAARRRRVFKWGVLDVLEHCPPWRACERCALHPECQARAKQRDPAHAGHMGISDALLLKSRVSLPVWQSEMLCQRPSRSHSVYPEFSDRHVVDAEPAWRTPRLGGKWIMGMDFGFRSPAVMLLAHVDDSGVICVLEERVESGCTVQEHIDAVEALGWPRPEWIGIDPAGLQVNDQTGVNARDVLTRARYKVVSRPCGVHDSVMLVRARIAPADQSRPRLLVSRRCPKLIQALTSYHYHQEKERSLEPVKDGPDHACDALRYMVINLDRAGSKHGNYINRTPAVAAAAAR